MLSCCVGRWCRRRSPPAIIWRPSSPPCSCMEAGRTSSATWCSCGPSVRRSRTSWEKGNISPSICAAMPHSTVPTLGASGAIAAVMGAFLITYPRDRIRTVLFLGVFADLTFIPAFVLIGLWFVYQLLAAGVGTIAHVDNGGVAYLAHVGGAAVGALAARWFEDPHRLAERAA